jgi:methyltransferase (TIGR00027 family)
MKTNFMFAIQSFLETWRPGPVPDLSNSVKIARLRFIQSTFEAPDCRNPDTLIGDFLSPPIRWLSTLQATIQLSRLQLSPFYYYLIARTKYYDQLFTDAIRSDIKYILNIGCGTDTRAYRFAEDLNRKTIRVLECDLPKSIFAKRLLAHKKWRTDHVTFVSIDLNDDGSWSDLEYRLAGLHSPGLVIMEGVSPYIDEQCFSRFLSFIRVRLPAGSRIAYDYKINGIADDVGPGDLIKRPFRLPATKRDVIAYHEALGYKLQNMELSSELSLRLLPNLVRSDVNLFTEDCLLELSTQERSPHQ